MLLSVLFLFCKLKLSVQKLFWSEKFAANINFEVKTPISIPPFIENIAALLTASSVSLSYLSQRYETQSLVSCYLMTKCCNIICLNDFKYQHLTPETRSPPRLGGLLPPPSQLTHVSVSLCLFVWIWIRKWQNISSRDGLCLKQLPF